MNRNILTILMVVIAVGLIMLKNDKPHVRRPVLNPLVVDFNEVHDFAKLRPGHIKRSTKYVLESANQILSEILTIPNGERSFDNTMVQIDDIYTVIESVWSPGYLMGATHTNEKIRDDI